MTWIDTLLREMSAHGLIPRDGVVVDGEIHRFHVAGDKFGSRNGWYLAHDDGRPTAIFGSWKTGEKYTFHGEYLQSAEDRREHRDRIARQQRQRQEQRDAEEHDAAHRALEYWNSAIEPNRGPGYLRNKAVGAHGIRQLGRSLLVPKRDVDGRLWSLEFIAPDGGKKNLPGGRNSGVFHVIGERTPRIWIAEGYSTAATLHEDLGECVIVAFGTANLLPVGTAIKHAWQPQQIAYIADDDWQVEGNPGITKAAEAAKAVGGTWRRPGFPPNRPTWATDYNDAARLWRAGRALG